MNQSADLLRIVLTACLVTVLLVGNALAGYTKKWGKVDEQVLAMTSYPPDSLAEAVVVFDVGEMEVTIGSEVEFASRRHYQIKILTEAGLAYADIAIPAWHEDHISGLKAHTILPNGKKVKLSRKNVHTEKTANNFKIKKFTLPSVEIGAVIEVQYKITSQYYVQLDPWVFQSAIPTLESTVILKIAPGFSYTYKVRNDSLRRVESMTDEYLDSDYGTSLKSFIFRGTGFPAVREAPYVSTLDNYKTRLDLQMSGYKTNTVDISFIKGLPTLCTELLESGFGEFQNPSKEVRKRTESLIGDAASESGALNTLYSFARDSLDVELHSSGYRPQRNQKQVLESMEASRAERNLLLWSMLTSAGYDVTPVLISTREHGRVISSQPFLIQYNHVILLLQTPESMDLLDATDPYTPLGNLPLRSLVGIGLIVDGTQPQLINIPNTTIKSNETIESHVRLEEEHALHGRAEVTSAGYASSYRQRQAASHETAMAFVTESFSPSMGSIIISELTSEPSPVVADTFTAEFGFVLNDAIDVVEDELYLRPALFLGLEENVFSEARREFPVEFGFRSKETEACCIDLDGRYEVIHLPEDLWINSKYVSYKRMTTQITPSQVNYVRILEIKEIAVPPADYETLRADFARIVDADAEELILKPLP